jgi:hypothetical protein
MGGDSLTTGAGVFVDGIGIRRLLFLTVSTNNTINVDGILNNNYNMLEKLTIVLDCRLF